jgi:hypothetical protein
MYVTDGISCLILGFSPEYPCPNDNFGKSVKYYNILYLTVYKKICSVSWLFDPLCACNE